jgi:hypothetical protein
MMNTPEDSWNRSKLGVDVDWRKTALRLRRENAKETRARAERLEQLNEQVRIDLEKLRAARRARRADRLGGESGGTPNAKDVASAPGTEDAAHEPTDWDEYVRALLGLHGRPGPARR